MQRLFPILLAGMLLAALAACSRGPDSHAVLAHVPADTPYVFANLEPLDADVLDAWMATSNSQIPLQVKQLREGAASSTADAPRLAGLMRTLADELDGNTWQQVFADAGVDLHGHFALYGLGLSPVLRGQLKDPARFDAFLDKLARGAGVTPGSGSLGDITYRHLDLDKAGMQAIAARHDGQFVLALLPQSQDTGLLRLALGADMPDKADAVRDRLATLADERGYGKVGLGYLDSGLLATTLTSGRDALLNALARIDHDPGDRGEDLAVLATPACQKDFQRIAARVPRITFGYSHLDTRESDQRVDIDLAEDISKAFEGITSPLPGLGADGSASLDIALALPVPEMREFWSAQANAVSADPFTCKPLAGLNKAFEEIGSNIPKTAIPPFGNLRGLRLIVDDVQDTTDASGSLPPVHGRLVLAMQDPASVLAMGQAMVPALKNLDLKADGRPVALPDSLAGFVKQPLWVAMNDKALALGVGDDQKGKLAQTLGAPAGKPGQLASTHLDGAMVASWMRRLGSKMAEAGAQQADNPAEAEKARQQTLDSMQAAASTYARLQDIAGKVEMTHRGLVIHSRTRLKQDNR